MGLLPCITGCAFPGASIGGPTRKSTCPSFAMKICWFRLTSNVGASCNTWGWNAAPLRSSPRSITSPLRARNRLSFNRAKLAWQNFFAPAGADNGANSCPSTCNNVLPPSWPLSWRNGDIKYETPYCLTSFLNRGSPRSGSHSQRFLRSLGVML